MISSSPHHTHSTSDYHMDYKQWLTDKVLVSLYANALFSITGSFSVFLILGWFVWVQIPSPVALYWSISGILIAAIRLALLYAFNHKKGSLTPRFLLYSYRLMSLCSGILNGMAMWLFYDHLSAEYQLLIYFSIVGLSAASSGTHAVDLKTFQLFMYSSCLLVVSKLIMSGTPTDIGLSIMIILYVLVMAKTGHNNNRTLLENFKLTFTMHYRATHDPLVDLLNRSEFENLFELNTPLTHRGVAFLFIDLDNFKPVNDTFGHQAGDQALKAIADVIKESLRADDAIARIGGDEFVAYLFVDDIKEVEKIAERILEGIKKISFQTQADFPKLSASIGIAFHHDNNVKYSQLLHAADLACYQSKDNGKNQATVRIVNGHS